MTREEIDECIKTLHYVEDIVYDLKKAKPISCYKMIGDAYIDNGRVVPQRIEETLQEFKDIKFAKSMIDVKDSIKAVVLGHDFVAIFFTNDIDPTLTKDSKVRKAIEEMFMRL